MKKKIESLENIFEEDEDSLRALAARAGVNLPKTRNIQKRLAPAPVAPAKMDQPDKDSLAGLAHQAKAALGKPAAPPEDLPRPLKAPRIPEMEPATGNAKVMSGDIQHPPGPFKAWEYPSERMDKDFPDPYSEHHDFVRHIQDPHAEINFRRLGGNDSGANTTLHGKIHVPGKGAEPFFAKPHGGMHPEMASDEIADAIGKRQEATYRLGSMMGMSHMLIPGKNVLLPGKAHAAMKAEDIKKNGYHLGSQALVTKGMDAAPLFRHDHRDLREELKPEEVQNAMLFHALTGHRDGHEGNVLIRRSDSGQAHPVLMDWDYSFHPHEGEDAQEVEDRKKLIRSVFAPGGSLDYQKIAGPVGKNFSPRTKSTLEWIANGGHKHPEHGLGLSDEDAESLSRNANDLLNHGLEGTLAKREVRNG